MMTEGDNETGKTRSRRTGQLSGIQVMFAAILAIGLILGLNFTSLISSGQPLQEAFRSLTDEIEALKQEQGSLIDERNYVGGDVFVERWARDEGKMVRPGEVLVIPVPVETTASAPIDVVPEAVVETGVKTPDVWTIWWALFFDTPPPEPAPAR